MKSPFVYDNKKRLRRQRKTSAFKHVVWRYPKGDKIVFLIYETGRIVILGGCCESDILSACQWLADNLCSTLVEQPVIRNVVVCTNIGTLMPLNILANRLRDVGYNICYEPELSPGIILRILNTTSLVFQSGKLTMTGIQDFEHVIGVVKHVVEGILKALTSVKVHADDDRG